MQKRHKKVLSSLFMALCFFTANGQHFYLIPAHQFQPYKVLWNNGHINNDFAIEGEGKGANFKMVTDSFEISEQITFGEYKEYINAIKRDSSYNFYISQLPDSAIASKENYQEYISNKKYEAFPVLGIRWEAAMDYCKWRTLQENKNSRIDFIYRLPKMSEWLAAYDYMETNQQKNDMNKNYSDWTMNQFFEGYGFNRDTMFVYDLSFIAHRDKEKRNKRVFAIGNSYLFQNGMLPSQLYFYIFNGYRQIAFRLVKESIKMNADKKNLGKRILDYWEIN